MKHVIDAQYFPGFTRKSLTFTIDDGNVKMDKKFLDIAKPAGLRGTFNLVSSSFSAFSPEGYRAFYDGFEIANHVRLHPLALADKYLSYEHVDAPIDIPTAEDGKLYQTQWDGVYAVLHPVDKSRYMWVAEREVYFDLTMRGKKELEAVFGEGNVLGFVWPYGEQKDPELLRMLVESGVAYVRKTGCIFGTTNYDFPADRMAWTYNAHSANLYEEFPKYEAYPDDGKLKFFSFGVHSVDFEVQGMWENFRAFCDTYGNRPNDFYYASVIDLFRYEDAVKSLKITETELINDSDIDLYVTVDGKRVSLRRHSSFPLL